MPHTLFAFVCQGGYVSLAAVVCIFKCSRVALTVNDMVLVLLQLCF